MCGSRRINIHVPSTRVHDRLINLPCVWHVFLKTNSSTRTELQEPHFQWYENVTFSEIINFVLCIIWGPWGTSIANLFASARFSNQNKKYINVKHPILCMNSILCCKIAKLGTGTHYKWIIPVFNMKLKGWLLSKCNSLFSMTGTQTGA